MSTGFERDKSEFARGGRAVVVLPDQGGATRDADARLAETAGLAEAIGLVVTDRIAVRLRSPKAATLIGQGQIEQIAATVRMEEADLVIFDAALTPVQQRNLETGLTAKVIDR
ncbi:MAG: GTPase HflX, partial [Sphingomonas sp.]|nr:GTPase HflX [Sphingomonas sp.]